LTEPPVAVERSQGIEHRPVLRGWFHAVGFFCFLAAIAPLYLRTSSTWSVVAVSIYVASILLLFGVSALFHRVPWGEVGRRRMRRMDHSTIFFAIAGSYTAVGGLVLVGPARVIMLVFVWLGALVGLLIRQIFLDLPKWVIAIPYVVVGWSAVLVVAPLLHALGGWGFAWLLAGGLAYTAGAVAYMAKRPNPIPGVLGYHEVFHAGTIVGASCHYIVILCFALPIAARAAS
jgi:hemolysin III